MYRSLFSFALLALLISSGCSSPTAVRATELLTVTLAPQLRLASPTANPIPTLTATQTFTLLPLLTLTPSPSSTSAPHPMDIQAMRQRSYPGNEIVIEKELAKGINYRQYDAWYRSDGLKIYGLLTVPDAQPPAGGFPALVFLHGYIEPTFYRTTEFYAAHVDFLARNGYVVFKIDLRGHDRSEGRADGGYASPGYTVDVLNAVSSLQRLAQVDPQKIGLWGHSMGGFLALRAMVISKQIKVGVIWAGLVCSHPDMIYRWGNDGYPLSTPASLTGWQADWVARYGTPLENPQFWASISATSFLKDLSGPVQLQHGTADAVVPVAFSEELAAAVQRAGGKAELYTYPGEDHNLVKSFTIAMTRSLQFLNQVLK
jgi:uncharacterized protein